MRWRVTRPSSPRWTVALLGAALASTAISSCKKAGSSESEAAEKAAAEAADHRSLVASTLEARKKLLSTRFSAQLRADLARAFLSAGKVQRAIEELEQALAETKAVQHRGDRDILLMRIALVYAEASAHDRAFEVARTISVGQDRSEVMAKLAQSEGDAAQIEDRKVREVALARLSVRLVNAGKYGQAQGLADKVSDPKLRQDAMRDFVDAQANAGNWADAKKILSKMEGIQRSEAQSLMAVAQYKRGQPKAAMKLAAVIESSLYRARAYANMAALEKNAKASASLLERALKLAEEVRDPVVQANALEEIARVFVRAGSPKTGIEIIDRAAPGASKNRLIAEVASTLAAKGEIDDASRLALRIKSDPLWSPEAFTALVRARARAGAFDAALDDALSITNLEFRLPALAEIAVAHELAGSPPPRALRERFEKALKLDV